MTSGDKDRIKVLGIFAFGFALLVYLEKYHRHTAHLVYGNIHSFVDRFFGTSFVQGLGEIIFFPIIVLASPPWVLLELILETFGWDLPPLNNWRAIPVWIFIAVTTWLWWYIALPRVLKFVGLWNPFRYMRVTAGRIWSLRLIVWTRDWWEINRLFGKGPTGGWADLIEVFSNTYRDGDIFLGRPKLPWHLGGFLRPIGIPTEKHMVTIAQTGSGKSVGALTPNLCVHRGSLLCIDPKGELAKITAPRRGQGGGGVIGLKQEVHVLDPFGIVPEWKSSSYNPFEEMERVGEHDLNRPVSYAGTIADALIKRGGSRDAYWDNAAHTLLRGLILYIFQGPREQRTLMELRRLLMQGDVEGHGGLQENVRGKLTPMDVLLLKMKDAPAGPYHDAIVGAAGSLLQMGPNQMGSVMTTAQEHTAFLDIPEIREVSVRSDFLLEDLKTRRVSVYLCLPLNSVSGKEGRWLRMFVLLFIDMMMRNAKAPKPPVLLAIDEFPNLGKLDGIEIVAPTMRSYGVRFWAIGQDIGQFQAVYPDSWESFIGGAEAVQFMGITHPSTVKYIADLIGQHVVVIRDQVTGEKYDQVSALLDLNQIPRMLAIDRGNQIIWRGAHRPMLLKICPYYSYLPFWYYARDNRFREAWNRWIWRWGKPPEGQGREPRKPLDLKLWPEFNPRKLTPPRSVPKPPDRDRPPEPPKPPDRDRPPEPPKPPDRDRPPKPPKPPEKPKTDREEPKKTWQRRDKPDPPSDPFAERLASRYGLPRREKSPDEEQRRSSATAELDSLIGLAGIKAQVRVIANLAKVEKARAKAGLPRGEVVTHLVFTGNPGTGKTTVARLIGQIYKDLGVLKSGHLVELDRSNIVGQWIGHTEAKMRGEIEKALDGVLFIDEAYSLAPKSENDFGAPAIQILLKMMEDNRERLVVIVAGYKREMKTFINSNTGLKSRFETEIDFPDYSPTELWEIFKKMCADSRYQMSKDAMIKAADLLLAVSEAEGGKEGFGNARRVRKIFRDCRARQAARLAAADNSDPDPVALVLLEASDIPDEEDTILK